MCTKVGILAAFLLSCIPLSLSASMADWPPVNPSELAMKEPTIDKEADAEALLWDVRVADDASGNVDRAIQTHYLRIKIFTDRGRDKLSTVDITFNNRMNVSEIAGRTIKANGEVVELKKDAVYERVLVKAGGIKVKAKSFAMPAVETGAIIEYRWKEVYNDQLSNYIRLQFERDIPVHLVKYHVKPATNIGSYRMKVMSFRMKAVPVVFENDGYSALSSTDMPAFKEEPDMPAEADVRPWVLLYYSEDDKVNPDKYWDKLGKELYGEYKSRIKVSDEMRSTAAEVVKGANTPEEKLGLLLDYVRKNFKNVTHSADVTSQEREKAKANKNTADTWKQKIGSGYEMALLYVALATSLDFDARMTKSGDHDYGTFDKNLANRYFLPTYSVAVKVGDKWKFCDPASLFLPFGMLRWQEEGQVVLISDPKQPTFSQTTMAEPADSMSSRTGKFRLNEEGTLEGDVRLGYTGHAAVIRKWGYQEQSPAEQEESVKQAVKSRFGDAEITDIKLEGATDPVRPLAITYHVKIPGYAQRTGRRLFLKVSYFQRDYLPRFSASARKFPVEFPYGWWERDRISYELPEGFALEKAESPGQFKLGEIGEYTVKIFINKEQRTLTYERDFSFGNKGMLAFPASSYTPLKQAFDRVQEQDDHLLTLRQGDPAAK